MKIGYRKPRVKKSISARTTGKVKRTVKQSVNPLYGKKGMGAVNNPTKSVYNKVYNQTTAGVKDIYNTNSKNTKSYTNYNNNYNAPNDTDQKYKKIRVPIGEHKTTKSERISQTIIAVILFFIASAMDLYFFEYFSVAFKVITIAIFFAIMIFIIVDAWKREMTTEYKKVYEDELTEQDIKLIQKEKPNYKPKTSICEDTVNYNYSNKKASNSHASELPWDFYTQNQKFLDPKEKKLVNYAVESKKKMDPEIKIKHFEKMIKYYYKFKEECYNKSPYFKLYFQQSWEHCYNSKNSDFEYIKPYEEKLERLKRKQINQKQSQDLTETQTNNDIRIIQESIKLLTETVKPDVFFSRLDLLKKTMNSLKQSKSSTKINTSHTIAVNEILENEQKTINQFIFRYYNSVKNYANTLKTDKGKANQYKKFYETLMTYSDKMNDDNIKYIKDILNTK